MIIEERKYNRKVQIICEKLIEASGWEVAKPTPQPNLPTLQGGTILLARDETTKKYIGFCRVVNSPWGDIWIMELCVAPEHRRKGIATALVNKVIKAAKGKVVIAWGVDQGPKLFESLGFKLSQAPVYFHHTN